MYGTKNICNTDCFFYLQYALNNLSSVCDHAWLFYISLQTKSASGMRAGGNSAHIRYGGHGGEQCLTGSEDGCHSSLLRPVQLGGGILRPAVITEIKKFCKKDLMKII